MSEQSRKAQSSTQSESASEPLDRNALEKKGKALGENLDALLDAIDDVLEENAAEFVSGYVQQGGQ